MRIIDISQEVFQCSVYPGDAAPAYTREKEIAKGELYNLSSFSMNAHNGTHTDAPAHFIADGKTVDQLSPGHFIGPCFVALWEGDVTGEAAKTILQDAERAGAADRILIGGNAVVTAPAAKVFAARPVLLLGNESQSVGPINAPMAVHLILLEKEVVLLEGIRLRGVRPGRYFLSALPLKLGGLEGAPCRAYLIDENA